LGEEQHAAERTGGAAAGAPGGAASVCLFAQYHPAGVIPAHTRRYLAALAGCGLHVHVACSGVERLAGEDAAFLAGIGAAGYPRANAGLDFGAWTDLLRAGCARGAAAALC